MKRQLLLLTATVSLLVTTFAKAQTNTIKVLTTNTVMAAPWFREVHGKLYNTQKSVLWKNMIATVDWVEPNGLLCENQYNTFLVQNYPKAVGASERVEVFAMDCGLTNSSVGMVRVWDCGTPHYVQVVSTNAAPINLQK